METERPNRRRVLLGTGGGLAALALAPACATATPTATPTTAPAALPRDTFRVPAQPRPAPPERPFTGYAYEWLTADPAAVGASLPPQPPLPNLVDPQQMPPVDEPVDEPMVPVFDRAIQLTGAYWHAGWPEAVPGTYLRAEVARRLVGVAAELPEPFGLAVLDGWRSLALQRQIFHAAYQDPALPPGFVSEPSSDPRTPPPHPAGGAVDVTLTYRHRPLALGTLFDAFVPAAAAAAFEGIEGPVRELRRLLTHRMLAAGFVAYPAEWWHFEYGTRRWAALTGQRPRYAEAHAVRT